MRGSITQNNKMLDNGQVMFNPRTMRTDVRMVSTESVLGWWTRAVRLLAKTSRQGLWLQMIFVVFIECRDNWHAFYRRVNVRKKRGGNSERFGGSSGICMDGRRRRRRRRHMLHSAHSHPDGRITVSTKRAGTEDIWMPMKFSTEKSVVNLARITVNILIKKKN